MPLKIEKQKEKQKQKEKEKEWGFALRSLSPLSNCAQDWIGCADPLNEVLPKDPRHANAWLGF
jgi:hypothetical protein